MAKRAVGFIVLFMLNFILSISSVTSATSFPLEQTVSRRQSIRSYTDENISSQQLLEALWAAYGRVNGHRNVPRIGYDYSLIIFPVNETGSYLYVPENNSLVVHDPNVNKETIRPHNQNWPSNASVVLVVVWNQTKMDNGYFASAEAGCLVQNVYLAAASLNLGTCSVGGVDSEGLRKDLKLPSTLIPLLVIPLGYPAKPYPSAGPNYDLMIGNLPPVQYGELSFEDSLKNMLFTRKWSAEDLSLQELSQLLWAAYGYTNVTHMATYHRTTPSSQGIYPIVVYVSNATGVYQYLPETHSIVGIQHCDKRSDLVNACSGQVWAANAPAIFLIVYNSSYNNGNTGDGGIQPHEFIEVDAGAVIQQLFLEASAWNLSANILSEGLDKWNGTGAQKIRNILGLPPQLVPLYPVPIGRRFPDTTPPAIGTPSQNPDFTAVEPYQDVTVTLDVADDGVGMREVILSYSVDEGRTWINTTMNNVLNNTYTGKIPGFEANTHIQYKIIAYDHANNSAVEDKNGEYYVYTVIPEFQSLALLIFMITTLIAVILTKTRNHARLLSWKIQWSSPKSKKTVQFTHKTPTVFQIKISATKLISLFILALGLITLAISIIYTSSILAFIGLGLTFWGALTLYVATEEYVKQTLLDSSILPSLVNLNHILTELKYKGKAIYLPPKYLKDFKTSKVYIPKNKKANLPTAEEIRKKDDKTFLKNPEAALIIPPGFSLLKLLEKTLGMSFTKVRLKHLQRYLSKLFIEDLEIAEKLEIQTKPTGADQKEADSISLIQLKNNTIQVKITNSIYKCLCKEAQKLTHICGSIGCPLCSAIACAIAKASAKPVTIEKTESTEDGKVIEVFYRIIEE